MFADRVSRENIFLKIAVNSFFQQTNSQPIVPQTAKEFMFGYGSSLLTVGNTFMSHWISFSKLGIVDRVCILQLINISLFANVFKYKTLSGISFS